MMVSNRSLLFQGSIFMGYVSFREGIAKGGGEGERLPTKVAVDTGRICPRSCHDLHAVGEPRWTRDTLKRVQIEFCLWSLWRLKCWFEGWRFWLNSLSLLAHGFWIMNYSSCQLSFSSKPGLMKDVVFWGRVWRHKRRTQKYWMISQHPLNKTWIFHDLFVRCLGGPSSSHQQSSNRFLLAEKLRIGLGALGDIQIIPPYLRHIKNAPCSL